MRRKISVFLVFICSTFFLANAQDVTPVNSIEGTLLNGNKDRIAFSQAEFHSEIKNKDNLVTLPFLNTKKDFNLEGFSIYGDEKNPYPEIKTYKISDTGNEGITGRITDGPAGTFLIYLQRGTMIRIYPDINDKSVYYQEIGIDKSEADNLVICDQHGEIDHDSNQQLLSEIKESIPVKRNGTTKRIYRAAIICTGEYYNANGGSTTTVRQRAIANLNDISAIFSQDLAVEFVMASGSPRVESDPNNDPFIPDQMGGQGRTIQAQNAISAVFPDFRYDVGHVFHTHQTGDGWSSGGLAGLGVVCNDDRKASAWSGSFSNNTNGFIQLAAHEFGHQFNATHTFNGSDGLACDEGNHPDNTAYEIGSGTTIMSYNGLCAADQNIPSSGVLDNYFHVNSLDLMVNYMEQFGVCNDTEWINDNNNEPVVIANPCGAEYNLPRQTPFFLTGSATDADGDNLTYCWEGYDEDGINMTDTHGKIGQDAANTSDAPLWRSFPPTSDPTRYFPRIENVKDNNRSDFEVLPNRARAMKMRLTVRDNNPEGGAVDWEQISINVESTMGPLQVTAPNGGETFDAGGIMTVTWNPRNSESMCTNAAIRLSTDGGATFPVTLASEVDYSTGTADVVLPASLTNTDEARIMVACDDYICFQ
ncbi:MAG: hypothetical protein KJO50_11655, partial [Bacteroidia bacterium]|nr:hypothetical protein [Bacteroidia bacterium]